MSTRALRIAIALLWAAVLGSSLAVVYGKHQSRGRFVELQRLTQERDELDIEWGQLQLEQSTLGTHGRVERVARDDLKMLIPQAADLRIVQP
jgi:cell division protein FtsL